VLGSGVTTMLRSLVHRLGPGVEGRPTWVFVADHGAGGLAGIDALDHVSCRLDGTDVARHARLITILEDVLDERRELSAEVAAALPLVVLVIDGLASFCELTDTVNAGERSELFNRIVRDGPGVGITIVAGATRVGELPRSLDAAIRQFFAMELADPGDYLALGIKNRNLPVFRPGRALVGTRPTVAQIIDWSTALGNEDVVPGDPPPSVEQLPDDFDRRELKISVTFSPELSIPFGIDDSSRGAATLVLRGGEHALIAGPSGSGRTTTLRTISRQLRDVDPALVLVAISPREDADLFDPGVFDAAGTLDGLENVLEMAKTDERRWVILIDDADQVDTESGALYDIVRNARSGLTVIASGRSTTIRQTYGHWLRYVRGSGVGVILNPDNGVDGELLTVRLPRGVRLPTVPGRGYRVAAGDASVIQVAR
jgi:S-DNA-T family DNA segregation ATPase FtsK/SpoIIIE